MQKSLAIPQVTIVVSQQPDGDFKGIHSAVPWLQKIGYKDVSVQHLSLEHGDCVAQVRSEMISLQNSIVADAAVLVGEGGLSLVVGDCIPIVLVDPEAKVLALIHGGWRSLVAGILAKTINEMVDVGAKKTNMWVWIGPGIRPCCYHSSNKPIQADEQDWCSAITKLDDFEQEKNDSNSDYKIDLPMYIISSLQNNGLAKNHIIDDGICTCCSDGQFFSHVRSKRTGEVDGRFVVAAFWNEQ